MKISKKQLEETVKKVVRQRIDEQASYFAQERLKQEVNILTLEFLEKLTEKTGLDPENLPPEVLPTFQRIHSQLKEAIRSAALEMSKITTVMTAASGEQ